MKIRKACESITHSSKTLSGHYTSHPTPPSQPRANLPTPLDLSTPTPPKPPKILLIAQLMAPESVLPSRDTRAN